MQRAQRKCPIFIALGPLQLGVFALETIQVVILKSGKIKAKFGSRPMNTCVSRYYFYSNRIAVRWRAGAQLTLTGEVQHRKKVANGAGRHKQVPDKMAVAQPVVGREKADAQRVEEPARHQPEQAPCGHQRP